MSINDSLIFEGAISWWHQEIKIQLNKKRVKTKKIKYNKNSLKTKNYSKKGKL